MQQALKQRAGVVHVEVIGVGGKCLVDEAASVDQFLGRVLQVVVAGVPRELADVALEQSAETLLKRELPTVGGITRDQIVARVGWG